MLQDRIRGERSNGTRGNVSQLAQLSQAQGNVKSGSARRERLLDDGRATTGVFPSFGSFLLNKTWSNGQYHHVQSSGGVSRVDGANAGWWWREQVQCGKVCMKKSTQENRCLRRRGKKKRPTKGGQFDFHLFPSSLPEQLTLYQLGLDTVFTEKLQYWPGFEKGTVAPLVTAETLSRNLAHRASHYPQSPLLWLARRSRFRDLGGVPTVRYLAT